VNAARAAGAQRMIATLSRLENAAKSRRLRWEANLSHMRSQIDAESAAALRAARHVRETSLWPHSLCVWLAQRADQSAAALDGLSKTVDSLEHERRWAGEQQQRWAAMRRGLERRVVRRAPR